MLCRVNADLQLEEFTTPDQSHVDAGSAWVTRAGSVQCNTRAWRVCVVDRVQSASFARGSQWSSVNLRQLPGVGLMEPARTFQNQIEASKQARTFQKH